MSPDAAPRRRIPPLLNLAVRLTVVFALLAWISTRVRWSDFVHSVRASDPRYLALAGLALVVAQLAAGWRWHRLLRAAGATWPFGRTFAVYAAGLFLSLFLPTAVGGDVYRIARVRGSGAGLARGTTTILLERAVGLLALLLLGTGFVAAAAGTRAWAVPLAVAALAGAVGLALLWIPGGVERLAGMLDRFPGHGLGGRVRTAFPPDVLERVRGALAGTLLLSLGVQACLMAVNVLLAFGLHVAVPWRDVCAAVPLVLLASQVPITPGGLGVREAGYVYFLGRVGVAEGAALAIALGWFVLLLAIGLLAAVGLLVDRDRAGPRPRGPMPRA